MQLNEEIMSDDPVNNREEFEKRLKDSFCAFRSNKTERILEALVYEDTEYLDKVKAAKDACDTRIVTLLREWDEAEGEEEKQQVVGSVKTDIEELSDL